jgi:hypothetical protein
MFSRNKNTGIAGYAKYKQSKSKQNKSKNNRNREIIKNSELRRMASFGVVERGEEPEEDDLVER